MRRTNLMTPSYEDVIKAQSMKGKDVRKTPLTYSPSFSQLTGSEIYLKSEFHQKTGSFKIRGAYFKIKSLTAEEKKMESLRHLQEIMLKELLLHRY